MYAVIRRYAHAPELFDELVQREAEVKEIIGGVPGFVGYYFMRSGNAGASITVCQDQAGTIETTRRAGEWVRQNVPAAAGSPPEVTEGEVLINF
jgi:hypothetical protein